MTPQEIQERSRQIEKMLGWELVLLNPEDKDTGDLLMYWFENEQLKRTYSGDEMEILEEDSTLPFDTNWNWLMEGCKYLGMEFVNTNILTTFKTVSDEARKRNMEKHP